MTRGGTAAWLLLALLQSGCFGYAYHNRGGGPAFSRVAVGREARRAVRWSYVWGLWTDEWTPIDCARPQPDGGCAAQAPVCETGVGRVEMKLTPYSVPLMLLTLGMAVPVEVSAYCSTDSAPVAGP